jgi:transposase
MATVPDLSGLSHAQKDALIGALVAQVEALTVQVTALTARVAELEAKLGEPRKTPNNSSLPPRDRRGLSNYEKL